MDERSTTTLPRSAPEPVLLSWSGGKDSALTLHTLRGEAGVEVVGLLTTVTERYERISMHGVRVELLHAQARALGLPVTPVVLSPGADNAADVRAYREEQLRTFVYDGPAFAARIRCTRAGQVTRDGRFRYQELLPG